MSLSFSFICCMSEVNDEEEDSDDDKTQGGEFNAQSDNLNICVYAICMCKYSFVKITEYSVILKETEDYVISSAIISFTILIFYYVPLQILLPYLTSAALKHNLRWF